VKKIVLAAVAAFLLPVAAQAAPAGAYNWSGPYVGLNAGYGLGHVTIDDQDCNISCSSQSLDPSGVTVGGVLGYNLQRGSAVGGIEADYNYFDGKKQKVTDWPSLHRANINSFGTVRARAGLALDNTLLYATAGLAIIDQDVAAEEIHNGVPTYGFRKSTTKVGLAAGVGAEMGLSQHLRMKMEYLYLATPADDNIHDQFTTGYCSTHTYCNYGYKTEANVVRVGVNYAF
jgi:outer membrane immunogenic protein